MIGAKLYRNRRRISFSLALYGILALFGAAYAVLFISRGKMVPGGAGFMIVFGAGMFIMTLIKSRKPVVVVHEDLMELDQAGKTQFIRYRNISAVSRPDEKRLVITLQEAQVGRKVTVWLKELERGEAEELAGFLMKKGWKGR
jgi:hypothetical protein